MEQIEDLDPIQRARLFALSKFIDDNDIREDLERLVHIKKLLTRLKSGKPNYRLIVNHLVILFNSFQVAFVIQSLKSTIREGDWILANTFLVFMKRSLDVVTVDRELLEKIKEEI